MANKTRYTKYVEGVQTIHKERQIPGKVSTGESVLKKLKKLKSQEFALTVPIGETYGK
jgi:hypothetical protein